MGTSSFDSTNYKSDCGNQLISKRKLLALKNKLHTTKPISNSALRDATAHSQTVGHNGREKVLGKFLYMETNLYLYPLNKQINEAIFSGIIFR